MVQLVCLVIVNTDFRSFFLSLSLSSSLTSGVLKKQIFHCHHSVASTWTNPSPWSIVDKQMLQMPSVQIYTNGGSQHCIVYQDGFSLEWNFLQRHEWSTVSFCPDCFGGVHKSSWPLSTLNLCSFFSRPPGRTLLVPGVLPQTVKLLTSLYSYIFILPQQVVSTQNKVHVGLKNIGV